MANLNRPDCIDRTRARGYDISKAIGQVRESALTGESPSPTLLELKGARKYCDLGPKS